jgi:hypothetical protein
MCKEKTYNNQLEKYSKLEENERIFIIDEKIFQEDSVYYKYKFGHKSKDRLIKAMLIHWDNEIRNYKHRLKRDITIEDIISLNKAMESYQSIMGCLKGGWSLSPIQIEKIDILEALISNTDTNLFEAIEFKKKGYTREGSYGDYKLAQEHVVTIIECDEYFTIKEIYIPYSGIVIQLPI